MYDVPDFTATDIEAALADIFGSTWNLERIYEETKSEGSVLICRADSADGRHLAVKQFQDRNQTRLQFEALVQLSEGHPDCVAPLYLDPDGRFFVMQWVHAPTLREKMQDGDRLHLIANAGRWLAQLHRRTRSRRPRYDPAMEAGLQAIDGPVLDGINRELARRRRRFWFRASRLSLLHTDFQPNNLFVDQGRMIGFDPTLHRRGNRYFDVAHFILGMQVARLRARLLNAAWQDDEHADRHAFLSGYGPVPRHRRAIFSFTYDLKLARMWRRRVEQGNRSPLQEAELTLLADQMRRRKLLRG